MENKDMNYYNSFILIAEDCPQKSGTVPQNNRGAKTQAVIQYELLADNPYVYTQEDVLFLTYLGQNGLETEEGNGQREEFFSKSLACLRASPLPKKYGWGIHFDRDGKIAIYGAETEEYQTMSRLAGVKTIKAMRNKRV